MAAAVAFEQDVAAEIGHIEVGAPVVVEVAGGRAHSVALNIRAAAGGHVVKGAVPAIPVQTVSIRLVAGRKQVAALNQIQVEIAVVVHVEQRGAAADDLRKVELVAMARAVNETNAGPVGDVFEPGLACPRAACRCLSGAATRNDRDDAQEQQTELTRAS